MASLSVAPDSVYRLLTSGGDARDAALAALAEAPPGPHERALAVAAAPALAELMFSGESSRATFQRASLLLARMVHETDDQTAVYGAAFPDGRLLDYWQATDSVPAKSLASLPEADEVASRQIAVDFACMYGACGHAPKRGISAPYTVAAGGTVAYLTSMRRTVAPLTNGAAGAAVLVKLAKLLTELVADLIKDAVHTVRQHCADVDGDPHHLASLLIGGSLWSLICPLGAGGAEVAKALVEGGVYNLCLSALRRVGSPGEWLSLSAGLLKGGYAAGVANVAKECMKAFAGEPYRRDHEEFVASGLFHEFIGAVKAFGARGIEGLQDTDHLALGNTLNALGRSGIGLPGCEQAVRGVAVELKFALDHSLELAETELGATTASFAAQLCVRVFGRDEGGSEFSFTQAQVDTMLTRWHLQVRAEGWHKVRKSSCPTASSHLSCLSLIKN
jgi:hypothetical protein